MLNSCNCTNGHVCMSLSVSILHSLVFCIFLVYSLFFYGLIAQNKDGYD